MKISTGIVRKVDELGRIVIPKELRRTLDLKEKDEIEIYVDGNSIVLEKHKDAVCLKCFTKIDYTDKYCRNCGTKL